VTSGQAAVARAAAAVFVSGRRAGSAVLVAPRYLITAAHVLQRLDPGTLAEVAVEQVELEFPAGGPGGQPGRTAAARVDLGPTGAGVDVAVLDLGEDRPGWLPAPVPVWPTARLPGRVQVFGYPLAEGPLNGVWRRFAVAGPATAGTVQLDWLGDAGTFPGHSGGPVIDAAGHALAGVLVEGAERGRFDRFVPVTLIARVWPGLPRPWLMTGADPGEARGHFTRRARGQRSAARGGDLFRGRTAALDRTRGWLTAVQAPGQPLVLTGQPGAGKSAVLARAALDVEAAHGGPGLAFHARGATIGDLLTALADLTGIDTPTSTGELVTSLAGPPGQSPILVVLDALDEAASGRDRRQITELLAELAVLPWLRVAVATRPLAVSNPLASGGVLRSLGVTTSDNYNLIDLDSDTYFDLEDLRQFAAALLAQDGMDHPGPPGAAWTQYRARHGVGDRLATVIAERAGRNFLVAAMAAVPMSTARTMIDPAAKGFNPAGIPSGVGEALSKYLDRLPDQRRERDRGLLTALAYARGAGVDAQAWLAFAASLGYDASVADLDALRRSPAADYLLQTTRTERGARPVTRLFHQSLTDELLAPPRCRSDDESAILDMLLDRAKRTSWRDRYLREHAAEHATAADRLDQLLDDALYLITVDPARLVPHLDGARSIPAWAAAAVYRQSAHLLGRLDQPTRASQLELTAHHLGCRDLAARIASAAPGRPWQTRWSHTRRATDRQVLTGHDGGVTAVAARALPDGTPAIISAGEDGTVRVWQLADGTPVGEPLRGHDGGVAAMVPAALPDGTPVIISGGSDRKVAGGTVRVWRLADGTPVGEPLRGHTGEGYHSGVAAVAAGEMPDGTPVIISGGYDGAVRVWRLADGTPVGEPLRGHDGAVAAVAAGAMPDGTPVIISGGYDDTARVWRLADGTPVGEPLRGHTGPVFAVAAGEMPDGTPVIISGGFDGTLRVWRLADGTPVGEPLRGHDDVVKAVAAGALPDGTPVVVSGGFDGMVRVWRMDDGTPVGEPLRGHIGPVYAVAAGALPDDTPVIVSGGFGDGTTRVWRLADGIEVGELLRDRFGRVRAIAVGALPNGTPVIVTAGGASPSLRVRVWRLADGAPVGEPLRGHTNEVVSVAVGALPDGTPVIVSGSWDGTVRVWSLADGAPVGEPLNGDNDAVFAVATGALPDGTPVIVSGGFDGMVRVWRMDDGTPVGEPLRGHIGPVLAVATGALPDGTPVIASGGEDSTARVWRLPDGTQLMPPLGLPESVRGVVVNGDLLVTAAGAQIAIHLLTRGIQARQ
jgi:WD40 repeat protein/V8-like Glu-specific endopeptidase